jgi:hypothetical protein
VYCLNRIKPGVIVEIGDNSTTVSHNKHTVTVKPRMPHALGKMMMMDEAEDEDEDEDDDSDAVNGHDRRWIDNNNDGLR